MKDEQRAIAESFYILEEAKISAKVQNKQDWLTTIIDLEDNRIKWQGVK
ncbi:MAG: hypothetical protein OHM56_02230 [Spiroplasma phoeniceum]|nr:MAG: hypothetical protein OHM57_01675 [Spiroplasma phoeniceum]UZQ32797.1 MAG: hypothetical protein OHM56_02230 [Spiroplasma phoeniceum]